VSGFLFLQAGGLILFGWFGGMPGQPSPPPLMSQTGVGGVLEFFGGIAITLGLLTRPVAFILSGMMAVAYWQFHAPQGAWPVQNQGMPAVLFCFIFLYMAAQGAGDWSLDALVRRKRATDTSAE
jgi:putative oxidoreductase